ncbi:hypothetical protein [Rhizobium mesosinicum]|uniref:Glycosyltransferase RgtA/B/C/D-like domain-containing protein n=1 Tax=Rhizobium mesosinicum TaxID=335017 RepID=A0ABS7H428_9HYPH|nr:hypothetical protein [Rhizobium mesosinicum]MBW9056656.1 hypothetical protein [Rhizobium mesosinicum]
MMTLQRNSANQLLRIELPVCILIVSIHAYALLVFGATFWIDSRDYVSLATAIGSPDGIQTFYGTVGQWVFSHLGPGVPILWLSIDELPVSWQWPVLAMFQHALAAAALIVAFRMISRLWPSPVHIVSTLLLLLLPAYQSFHNALLTESCTSSLALIGFSCCVNIVRGGPNVKRNVVFVLGVIVFITQFRSYWGAIVASMLFCSLITQRLLFSRWTLVLFAISAISTLLFPAYRYAQTGQFFLPSGGINLLISGSQANRAPSIEVTRLFDRAGLPPTLEPSDMLRRGVTMDDALKIAEKWRSDGLSNAEINQRSWKLARALGWDGLGVQSNKILYGMASIGAILPVMLLPERHEVFPAYSPRMFFDHLYSYYLWQSWTDSDYRTIFERFFGPSSDAEAAVFPFGGSSNAKIYAAFGQHISTFDARLRDPLYLGRSPPDFWLMLALIGVGILVIRARSVGILLLCAVLPAFAVAYEFPLGNPRYSVPLLPLYFIVTSISFTYPINGLLRKLGVKAAGHAA